MDWPGTNTGPSSNHLGHSTVGIFFVAIGKQDHIIHIGLFVLLISHVRQGPIFRRCILLIAYNADMQ